MCGKFDYFYRFHDWTEIGPNRACVPNYDRLNRFVIEKEEKEPSYKGKANRSFRHSNVMSI